MPTWQPDEDAPATWSPPLAQPVADGLTVTLTVTAYGGLLTELHGLDLQEHGTHGVAQAVTSKRPLPRGVAMRLPLVQQQVTARPTAPLGNRVLVDDDRPVPLTRSSTTVVQQAFPR